jgi:hypothetical protein
MSNILFPEMRATIQVVAVQNLTGRKHPHVRVFGYRTGDVEKTIIEVALQPEDAVDLIAAADKEKSFPEIDVPANAVVRILTTAGIDVIHIGEVGDDPNGPPLHPRRGA